MFTKTNRFQTVMQSGKHKAQAIVFPFNLGNFKKHFQLISLSCESQLYSFTDSFIQPRLLTDIRISDAG